MILAAHRKRLTSVSLVIALVSLAIAGAACANDGEKTPTSTLGITYPYILSGAFTVAGEPGPEDSSIFTMINGKPSGSVAKAPREGFYSNVLAGANTSADIGAKVTFHLGDPDGDSVEAEESITFNEVGSAQLLTMELTFPRFP